ncbi:MAG: MerR family transcriptional regulator [Armatimonadetes bacterium]|nr:MerR family transcriptional regulator [Armatimonadota bacterium]MDE2207223.1 MerR family transcriptional regulator [Armatimonadota bacterium]
MDERTDGVYMIGVVAELTQMHAQTIRLYERLGLVAPMRRSKNRLYSEADVERLRQIRRLTQDMGVNLAGVEVILDLLAKLERTQNECHELRQQGEALKEQFRAVLEQLGRGYP